jgi:hypothetical protein
MSYILFNVPYKYQINPNFIHNELIRPIGSAYMSYQII